MTIKSKKTTTKPKVVVRRRKAATTKAESIQSEPIVHKACLPELPSPVHVAVAAPKVPFLAVPRVRAAHHASHDVAMRRVSARSIKMI